MIDQFIKQIGTTMNHPLILLFSFIFALIGFLSWANSIRVKIKTKKENDEFEEKNRLVINELATQYKAKVASSHLKEINEQIREAEEKLEQDLPYQLENAVIEQKILVEESLILAASNRLEELKKQRIGNAQTVEQKGVAIFFYLNRFIISAKAKNIIAFLSIITSICLLSIILLPDFFRKSIATISIIIAIFYIVYLYRLGKCRIFQDFLLYGAGILLSFLGLRIMRNVSNVLPLIIGIITYMYFARNHKKRKIYIINILLFTVGFLLFALCIGSAITDWTVKFNLPIDAVEFFAVLSFCTIIIMMSINVAGVIDTIRRFVEVHKENKESD